MKPLHLSITTERAAKEAVSAAVQRVKRAAGVASPLCYRGIDDPVARHLGIRVIEQRRGSDASEGMYLRPGQNSGVGQKIILDLRVSDPDRLNFTFFHEITHYLIEQDVDLLEYLNEYAIQDYEQVLERLCNVGAAEFLIPREEVWAIIDERGFRISLVEELDQLYAASKPAIAFQLAQCAPHRCVVVICDYGRLPSAVQNAPLVEVDDGSASVLFSLYTSSSPSFKYPVGRYVPIPQDHLLWDVYTSRSHKTGLANIPLPSGKSWAVNCEGFFYLGKVYAVFNETEPPSPSQMSLFG